MELVTPGLGLIIWMTLSFTVVLLLLRKFAWKPILSMIKEREKTIEEALHSAEKAKNETITLIANNEALLEEAKRERVELLKDARKAQDRIISEAHAESENIKKRMITEARETIDSEKKKAILELKAEIAGISVSIAEKLLQQELSKELKQDEHLKKLIDEVKIN